MISHPNPAVAAPRLRVTVLATLAELECALSDGFADKWDALFRRDPHATLFQCHSWCVPWYRVFEDEFEPRLLMLHENQEMVGLIPLAIERHTLRLTFAGDTFSDYRDLIARPEYRRDVLRLLLAFHAEGPFRGVFRLGPTQPDSPTVPNCQTLRTHRRAVFGSMDGSRMLFGDGSEVRALLAKKYNRRAINYFKRLGAVEVSQVKSFKDWEPIRDSYYRDHSLRRLQAGRPMVFDEVKARDFHEALFQYDPSIAHVSVLRVGDRIVAQHYGWARDATVFFGSQGIDIREQKSPSHVLLAMLMQELLEQGYACMDFTLGDTDFKRRFTNQTVTLPLADLHATRGTFWRARARRMAVGGARTMVTGLRGEGAWERFKDWMASLRSRLDGGWLREQASQERTLLFEQVELSPDMARRTDDAHLDIHVDEPGDLLSWKGCLEEMASVVQLVSRHARPGLSLYTVLCEGELVGWGLAGSEDHGWRIGPARALRSDIGDAVIGAITRGALADATAQGFATGSLRLAETTSERLVSLRRSLEGCADSQL